MFEWYRDWFNFDSYQCWAEIVSTWHPNQFREMISKYSIQDNPTETDGEEAVRDSPLPWQPLGSTWPITNLAATTIPGPVELSQGMDQSIGTGGWLELRPRYQFKASNRLGGRLGPDG